MAAYHRVYDSRHLQADCQEPGSAPELGNRVWSAVTFFIGAVQMADKSMLVSAGCSDAVLGHAVLQYVSAEPVVRLV